MRLSCNRERDTSWNFFHGQREDFYRWRTSSRVSGASWTFANRGAVTQINRALSRPFVSARGVIFFRRVLSRTDATVLFLVVLFFPRPPFSPRARPARAFTVVRLKRIAR